MEGGQEAADREGRARAIEAAAVPKGRKGRPGENPLTHTHPPQTHQYTHKYTLIDLYRHTGLGTAAGQSAIR